MYCLLLVEQPIAISTETRNSSTLLRNLLRTAVRGAVPATAICTVPKVVRPLPHLCAQLGYRTFLPITCRPQSCGLTRKEPIDLNSNCSESLLVFQTDVLTNGIAASTYNNLDTIPRPPPAALCRRRNHRDGLSSRSR